jgi:hypothetical protein
MGSCGPEGKEGRGAGKDRSLPKGRENRLADLAMASTWRLRIDFKTVLEYFMMIIILGLIV